MGAAVTASRLINRNVVAKRGRTSMRLEPELWDALTEISEREGKDLSGLVRKVEATEHPGGRTSAMRVFVLEYFRLAATDSGHAAAGHGELPRPRFAPPPAVEQPAVALPPPPMILEEARSAA
jgi:predicted DNA-binding ribbon-helix-helix protein